MEKRLDYAKIICDYAAKLRFEDLPAQTVVNTRQFLLDYYAAVLAGYRINRQLNTVVTDYILSMRGAEEATVFFSDRKAPCAQAAYLNACYAHGADMDDGNRKAMGHIGATVISAALAVAETCGATETEVLTAIVAGYDVFCRLGAAVQPGLVHRGFHSTGTVGALASAVTAAKLMKLDADGIYHALAMSVTMSSGLMLVTESGQAVKALNPAKAAQNGIEAAVFAKRGIVGGAYPLDSSKGWFHAMSDTVAYDQITDGLGETFCVDESYLKPYPSCRHTHGVVQAIDDLRKEYGFAASDVREIRVRIYENAIRIAGCITCPDNTEDTKFSIAYAAACMLVLGHFMLDDLDLTSVPPEVLAATDKIVLISDPTMENRDAGVRGCSVEIELQDGTIREKTILIPKGDAQNRFTDDELEQKLRDCGKGLASEELTQAILRYTRHFAEKKRPFTQLALSAR